MDEPTQALARELVTLPAWRWMPGMLTVADEVVCSIRVWKIDSEVHGFAEGLGHRYSKTSNPRLLPDLTDPATLGCLLHLVREKHGTEVYIEPFFVYNTRIGWRIRPATATHTDAFAAEKTRLAALVAALR